VAVHPSQQSETASARGGNAHESSGTPSRLALTTGFRDDRRRNIDRGTDLFACFEAAWLFQDVWSAETHREFWLENLQRWPNTGGRPPTLDTLGWWARQLRRDGMSDQQVAQALGVEQDTLRRQRVFAHGDELYALWVDGPLAQAAPRLPRIYDPSVIGTEPTYGRINLPSGTRPPSTAVAQIDAAGRRARTAWFAYLDEGTS
jgi:hypothetical protein